MSNTFEWQLLARDPRFTVKTLSSPVSLALTDLETWERRRALILEQLHTLVGRNAHEDAPAPVHILSEEEHERFHIKNVAVETLPGYYVYANLYVPNGNGKFPAVLHPHGHWPNGRFEDSAVASVPARCINLALRGYVSLSYDMVGYGDSRQIGHQFGGDDPEAMWWGVSLFGLQIQNGLACLEYLASLPYVDNARIACTGASGGGSQTIMLAALDERIKVAAPVNMISATCQGWCLCENPPSLRVKLNNLELAGLIAPRPLLMVSASGDWTQRTPDVEYPQLRRLYELYGRPDHIANVHIDAAHNYNMESRQAVYRWFDRWLLNQAADEQYLEIPYPTPPRATLSCDSTGLPKATAPRIRELLLKTSEADAARALAEAEDRLRDAFALTFGIEGGPQLGVIYHNDILAHGVPVRRTIVRRGDSGELVPLTMVGDPTSQAGILVTCNSAASFIEDEAVAIARVNETRRVVVLVEPFLTDLWVTPYGRIGRNQASPFFATYNRTDVAEQVRDVITAIDFIERSMGSRIDALIAMDSLALTAIFAAAMRPTVSRLVLKGSTGQEVATPGADGSSSRWLVPGLGRRGGLRAAAKLLGRRAVVLAPVPQGLDEFSGLAGVLEAEGVSVEVVEPDSGNDLLAAFDLIGDTAN